MFVLDTNTLIYFFKGMGNVGQKLLTTPPRSIIIPSIVIYELEYGIARSTMPEKRRIQLDEICQLCKVNDFTHDTAKIAAKIRAVLFAKGTPIGPHDILIAAFALEAQAPLVTRNTDEFSKINELVLENWF